MRLLGCLFLALAIALGLAGSWILMSCLAWSAFQAWTWNDDDLDVEE